MSAALEQGGVPGQVERPSLVAVDAVADRLPAGTVPVDTPVRVLCTSEVVEDESTLLRGLRKLQGMTSKDR